MELTYQKALDFVLEREGGYVNNPHDKGGATNYGITQATYSNWRLKKGLSTKSVAVINRIEVEDIYREQYWVPSHAGSMEQKTALVHFDWAVNHGVVGAIKTLQFVVSVSADGIYGPKTENALRQMFARRGDLNVALIYCAARKSLYYEFAHGDQARFLQGWLNRVSALEQAIKIA